MKMLLVKSCNLDGDGSHSITCNVGLRKAILKQKMDLTRIST